MTNFEFCRDSIHSKTTESCILLFLCTLDTCDKIEELSEVQVTLFILPGGHVRASAGALAVHGTLLPRQAVGPTRAPQTIIRCHAGSCKGAEQISIDVGLWVAVCFLAKISFHRPTCKTTFARLTQSQAISQSFRFFITFRSMRDTTFFHFSKLIFCTKYRFFYHGDQKMSWWCRWRAVNFEIHL